jgi:hypothetical protein
MRWSRQRPDAMTNPAPLVPADVDLRDFGFMPLDVLRLRDSDLMALSTGDEFKAAVSLWCVAWHQVPAASLPNDDRLLARYSGAVPLWKKVREGALRGFVECSDGRLYHSTIAEKARESWDAKLKQRERTAAATKAREEKRRAQHPQRDDERNVQRDVERDGQRNVVQGTVKGQGQGIEDKPPLPPRGGDGAGKDPGTPSPTPYAAVCIALKAAGIPAQKLSPSNPTLQALVDAGATAEEFVAAAGKAIGKGEPFAYLLGVVEGERKRAAATAGQLHRGALPTAPPATTPGESVEAYQARMAAEREADRQRMAGSKGPSPEVKAQLAALAGGMRTT